jgi:RNA polymerase sigma-70 factor (ECF subfamily)
MAGADRDAVKAKLAALWRDESRAVRATLVRLLGDLDLAEEALHDAFAAALVTWPRDGMPANARAWLVSTGRFRAIDALRRRARFDAALAELAAHVDEIDALRGTVGIASAADGDDPLADDSLRLMFLCCHPALPEEAQVALTLREVCGLATEEIARAFLVAPAAMAQRIVRAKARLREHRVAFDLPDREELPARLDAVLRVVYLVFNEGYFASAGATLGRADLAAEAIRLARLLAELLPDPEANGLLALLLLHDARRAARVDAAGDLVPLEEQERGKFDRVAIAEGIERLEHALASRRFGPYTLQAAIAAVHAEAPSSAATDWTQIVGLYDLLLRVEPSRIVELNRAAALAMRDGPAAGLARIDELLATGELDSYAPAHAARGDCLRRLARAAEARAAFEVARSLSKQEPEQRFFERRLRELG